MHDNKEMSDDEGGGRRIAAQLPILSKPSKQFTK